VTLWDVASLRKRGTLVGPAPSVNRLAFSPPDGRWLAVGTSRGTAPATVALWDWQNKAARPFYLSDDRGPQDTTALAFSRDGYHLVAGKTCVALWDFTDVKGAIAAGRVDERGVVRESTRCDVGWRPGDPVFWDVAWRNSTTLATACWDRKVELVLWSPPASRPVLIVGEHRAQAFSVAFSPDGALLASGGGEVPNSDKNSEVKIYDAESGCELATWEGHTGQVRALAFTRDGRALVSASGDATVRLWDLSRLPKRSPHLPPQWTETWSVAYSPDGRLLAMAGRDGLVKLWGATTGSEGAKLGGHKSPIRRAVFSPDGKVLASGGDDGTVRLWEMPSTRLLREWPAHAEAIFDLVYSPDGKLLATGSRDRTVKLWDAATGDLLRVLTGHTGEARGLVFAPDGKVLVSASHDGTVRFWDVATGECRQQLLSPCPVWCVAYSPDGGTLAWGGNDGVIHRWDVAAGEERDLMSGHARDVRRLAFTPDGRTLASASEDRTVRLWCPITGREFLTLRGHNERVYGVAFDPAGKTLASVSHDGTVRLWRADRDDEAPPPAR
jgi:WD40 repeat protein